MTIRMLILYAIGAVLLPPVFIAGLISGAVERVRARRFHGSY